MDVSRNVCGWCPIELPADHEDWYLHFLVEHGTTGFSVRHYPVLSVEEEMRQMSSEPLTDGQRWSDK